MTNDATAAHARTAAAITAIAAVLATTAACGAGGEAGGQGGAAASPSSSTAPSSTPSPSPSDTAVAEPEDGTDLSSCADAECEVRVSEGDEIPLGEASGLDRMVVSEAGPNGVSFKAYGPGVQMGASGYGPPFSEKQAVTGLNNVLVYIHGADEDGAVIRLALKQ